MHCYALATIHSFGHALVFAIALDRRDRPDQSNAPRSYALPSVQWLQCREGAILGSAVGPSKAIHFSAMSTALTGSAVTKRACDAPPCPPCDRAGSAFGSSGGHPPFASQAAPPSRLNGHVACNRLLVYPAIELAWPRFSHDCWPRLPQSAKCLVAGSVLVGLRGRICLWPQCLLRRRWRP